MIVGKELGSGGQGSVYLVKYNGKPKALKWFHIKKQLMSQEFRDNLKKNIMDGSPDPRFIWPLDMTDDYQGSYGYIMDLKPEGYYELTDFLTLNVCFKSFKQAVDACLNIVASFRNLHNKGYSYQDLNDGNFFIDPDTGRVLIADNDNVAPDKTTTGILGKARFMAPEIVLRTNMPDVHSDRYSMAVIIFLCLCLNHPLEGKRTLSTIMTDQYARHIYGSDAKFIMDPEPNPNGAVERIHSNVLSVWPYLPTFVRQTFLRAFSEDALKIPQKRLTEIEWIQMLVRLRSSIVSCQCGNQVFVDDGQSETVCDNCGKIVRIRHFLDLGSYKLPAIWDTRLYKCQTGVFDADEALEPVAHIIVMDKENRKLGIRNLTKSEWNAVTSHGRERTVKPGDMIPLVDRVKFKVNDIDIVIREMKEE